MDKEEEKKSLEAMLKDAAIDKYGLKGVMADIEAVKPLLEQVKAGQEMIRGEDGKTPEIGKDYLTEADQKRILEAITPKKGEHYFDGEDGGDGKTPIKGVDYFTQEERADMLRQATPIKGTDYFTSEELSDVKQEITPVKGKDYNDGANPTPEQFIEVIKGLKGKDAAAFSQTVGAKIDISHVRNAGSFIFNGKKYKTEELMHGGGVGGGGGTPGGVQYDVQLNDGSGGFAGSDNLNFQGGYLTINGDSGYGQLQWLNTPVSAGYGGAGINGTATPIIVGAANGDLSIWSSQAMNFSADAGSTNMLQINANGTIDIGSLASLTSQFVIADLNGELSSQALLVDGVTITGDGINTPLTASGGGGGVVVSVVGTTNRITVDSTDPANPIVNISGSYVGQSSITTLGTVSTGTWSATAIGLSRGGTGVDLSGVAKGGLIAGTGAGTVAVTVVGSNGKVLTADSSATGGVSWQTPTTGTVTSVSGTSARITSTGGTTPVIDIDATYVGQTSITTLGTIATGTWSATTIALNKGGTGQTTKAAAFDALQPMTTGGDIIYGGASGTGTRLANGSSGQVLTSGGTTVAPTWATITAAGLTVGTSTITSGTTTRILYDNAGVLGEYTLTGTGTVVVMATSPTITTAALGSSTATTQSPSDNSTKLATTAYVDAAVLGQNFKEATLVATTANLVGVYLSNVFTYTATGTNAIDGVTLALGNRVLVKNQITTFQNGWYVVTTAGAIGVAGVLTRSTDANTSAEFKTGDSSFVTSGTANSNTTWAYTGVDSPTLGTDAITYAQTAGQGSFTQGAGITITGNSIALTAPVTVALGGTNATSASITSFNNITGYTASGATGTTSTNLVFSTSPTLVTPTLGAALATSINGLIITTTTGTLTMTNSKTLAVTNTLTLSGTDSTVMTFPTTTATIARTDAAQTFTGTQTVSLLNTTPQALSVTSNAATADISHGIQNFTNSSASAMTITLTTTSAADGQWKEIRIYDFSAVAQGITFVNTENSLTSVPTTSNGSTTLPLSVLFQFNGSTSKWRCLASS